MTKKERLANSVNYLASWSACIGLTMYGDPKYVTSLVAMRAVDVLAVL